MLPKQRGGGPWNSIYSCLITQQPFALSHLKKQTWWKSGTLAIKCGKAATGQQCTSLETQHRTLFSLPAASADIGVYAEVGVLCKGSSTQEVEEDKSSVKIYTGFSIAIAQWLLMWDTVPHRATHSSDLGSLYWILFETSVRGRWRISWGDGYLGHGIINRHVGFRKSNNHLMRSWPVVH